MKIKMTQSMTNKNNVNNVDDDQVQIPLDLIMEILCWLPPKVVFRFRCLSKQCKSLIDNYCIPKLGNRSPLLALLVKNQICKVKLVNYTDNHKFLYPCFNLTGGGYFLASDFRDCCNGFLLLRNFICSPSTKQFVQLPEPYPGYRYFRDAAVAFDPSISPHYKVMEFVYDKENQNGDNCCYCNIFSSKTWSWKIKFKFGFKHRRSVMVKKGKSVYFDKAVYKLCGDSTRYLVKFPIDPDSTCSAVDYEGASGSVIELPTPTTFEYECLGVGNGNICYACLDRRGRPDSSLKIWMLKSNSCIEDDACFGWVLKFNVSFESIAGSQPMSSIYPCAFHPTSDKIFLGCNIDGRYSNIYAYDLTTERLLDPHRKLFSLNQTENFLNFIVFPCAQCYVPLVRQGIH